MRPTTRILRRAAMAAGVLLPGIAACAPMALIPPTPPMGVGAPGRFGPDGFAGPDAFADSPQALALTASVAADAYTYSVAASPKGDRVAFASPAGVFVADAGAAPRKLAERRGPVNELIWTPDGRYLVFGEREVDEVCVPQGEGRAPTCSSSSADEIYRVRRVAVADGTATTLAEHVAGFHDLAAAPSGSRVAFLRSSGPSPIGPWAVTVLDPETGAMTTISGDRQVADFAWSPDASAIAFIEPDPGMNEGGRVRGVHRATLAGEVTKLGAVTGDLASGVYGPFWQPDGQAVRLAGTLQRDRVPVLEFPSQGGPTREYAVGQEGFMDFRASPDGRWLLATRMKGLREPGNTVQISLEDQAIHDVGPAGMFMGWVGAGPRFLARVGQSSVMRYYVVTPTTVGPATPEPCPTSEGPPVFAFDPPMPRIGQPFTVRLTARRGPRDTETWPPDGSYTLHVEKFDVVSRAACGPQFRPLEPSVRERLGTITVANGRGEATFTLAPAIGAVVPEAGKGLFVYAEGARSGQGAAFVVGRD